MIPNNTTLKRFLKAKMNFFVYGPRASGKTTLLKNLFKEVQIDCIYINCTMGDKKQNFFRYLNHQLDKFFQQKIKNQLKSQKTINLSYQKPSDPSSVHQWIENVKNLPSQLKQLLKQVYFFIDNIQQIHVSTNFMTTFFSACQQNMIEDIKIPFVFCGITLPKKIYAIDKPFRNITSFCMKKPLELMKQIILQDVTKQFKASFLHTNSIFEMYKFQQKDVLSASSQIANIIYHAFQPMQTDLNRIKKMTNVLSNKIAESVKGEISQELERNKKLTHKSLQKRMTSKINKGQIKVYTRQMLEQGPLDGFLVERKVKKQSYNQQANVQLPYEYYPNLIMASLHLADLAPQSDDKRRFQDYRKQKGKMSKHVQNRMQKHNLQRVIAISQVLQSNGKKDGPQFQLEHHSLNYYSCFQFLREQSKLFFQGKTLSFATTKIHGDTKEQQAKTFIRTKLDSSYEEYALKN